MTADTPFRRSPCRLRPSRWRRASFLIADGGGQRRYRIDERLILAGVAARRDRQRLAMRRSPEGRHTHVRHPNLNGAKALGAQAGAMLADHYPGGA